LGQRPFIDSAQARQNVHSYEQTRASALLCGSAISQRSHFSRILSAILFSFPGIDLISATRTSTFMPSAAKLVNEDDNHRNSFQQRGLTSRLVARGSLFNPAASAR
jgi:hypothetical protein